MPNMGYQEYLLPKWNARHGHEVHVVASDRYTPVPHYEDTFGRLLGPRHCGPGVQRMDGMTLHRLPCSWERGCRPWLKGLTHVVAELSPDVLFFHGTASPNAFRIARFAKGHRIPLVMDNHMCFSVKRRGLSGRLFYVALRIATRHILAPACYRLLGVAQECCDFLRLEQSVPAEKVECLPLGLDTDLFKPDDASRQRLRGEHGIPSGAKVVMQTGKLTPKKAPHWLSKAMARIMANDPSVWLLFVGSGAKEYMNEVRAPLLQKGVAARGRHESPLRGRLRFIPFVPASELAGLYNMADVCVYAGAASLSCLEAAGCGKAVIMTDLPASRWRADLGVGTCYKTGDVEDLARKIEHVLRDDAYRQQLGERGRAAGLRHFSYDAIARKSEELMYQAIEALEKER